MYIGDSLNNSGGLCNNSAQFTNDPILFVCIGQQYCYSPGAVDPDGDSLSYRFIQPRGNTATDTLSYNSGYSITNPISSSPPVSIDSVTGQVCMTPTAIEVGVIVVEITEWRTINGVKTVVGTTMRDMQVYTQVCNNTLPLLSGIDSTSSHVLNICGGASTCFNIYSNDPDTSQWLRDSLINNSGFSISFDTTGYYTTALGTHEPIVHVCISTTAADIGHTYNFTITIRDNFCPTNGNNQATYSIVVSGLTASGTGVGPTCFGGNNGTATASVNGTGPFTYNWSNGQTSSTATGLSASTYTVTITTSSGCSASTSVTLPQGPQLTASGSAAEASCFGSHNGSASASLSGGTGPYQYLWSPVQQTTQTAIGLSAGSYSVLITDSHGCTATTSVSVAQPTAVSVSIANLVSPTCTALGSFDIVAAGGTPTYTYFTNTNPNQTTTHVDSVAAGSYTVTVRDAHGCRINTSLTLTAPTALFRTVSQTDITCHGGNNGSAGISATGGVGNYTYTWVPSVSTGQNATGLSAGTYAVTVADNPNGCTTAASFTITEPTAVVPSAIQTTSIACNGGTGTVVVSATGGTGGYSGTGSFNELAGTHSYTVTDANGCSATASVTITQPTALSVSSSSGFIACNSGTTTVVVTPSGGTPPYSGTGPFTVSAGPHSYTVTDANGCTSNTSITVTEPTLLVASVSQTATILCNGGNGTLMVSANGGTSPYNGTGSFTVVAGTYTYVVTDANGCTSSSSIMINQPAALTVTETHVDVVGCVCTGFTPGNIDLSVSGGAGSYSYVWNPNVSNGSSASGLSAGTYNVTITDGNGCTGTLSVTIGGPNPLSLSFNHTDATCEGQQDGSATVVVTGGQAPFTYLWFPSSQTTVTATGLGAGFYVVRVKDSTGCTVFSSVAIGFQHARPVVDLGSDVTACLVDTLDAGAGFSSYLWSDASTGQKLVVTVSGTYAVTVTDVNGCQNSSSVNVTIQNCAIIGGSNGHNARLDAPAQGLIAYVYPNPATDVVNVAINGIKSEINVKLELADMLGNKVASQSSTPDVDYIGTISLSNLPVGIYFLKVQYDNQIKTIKVVKQ